MRRSEKIREAGIVGNDIGLQPHAAHLPQQLQDFGPISPAQLGDDFGVLSKRLEWRHRPMGAVEVIKKNLGLSQAL